MRTSSHFHIKTPPFYEVNSFNRKWLEHGGISKMFFLNHFSPKFKARNAKISSIFHFDQVKNDQICHVLCVNHAFCIFGKNAFPVSMTLDKNILNSFHNITTYIGL